MIKISHSSVDNSSKTVDKSVDKSTFYNFTIRNESEKLRLSSRKNSDFLLSFLHSSYTYYYYLIYISLSFKQQQQYLKTIKQKSCAFYSFFSRNFSVFLHNLNFSARRTCEQRGSAVFSPPALSRRVWNGELKINPLIKSFPENNLPISGVYIKLSFLRAAVAWLSLLTNHAAAAAYLKILRLQLQSYKLPERIFT